MVHRRIYWPILDPTLSLSSPQPYLCTNVSDIKWDTPIFSKPEDRWNSLTRQLFSGYATMWQSLKSTWTRLFKQSRTATARSCFFWRKENHIVSHFVVTRSFLSFWIFHHRYWVLFRHCPNPSHLVRAFCKNSAHSKHVLTKHWKTPKRVTRPNFTSQFPSLQRFCWANTYSWSNRLDNSV